MEFNSRSSAIPLTNNVTICRSATQSVKLEKHFMNAVHLSIYMQTEIHNRSSKIYSSYK